MRGTTINDLDRDPHPERCPGFEKEEWSITRERLKQTLYWGFGVTAQAFDKLWDETPTPRTKALPVPPAAAGVRPPSPAGSSVSDELVPMPMGRLLEIPEDDSTDYRVRYPLGTHVTHPSVRKQVSVLVPCPEPALVPGDKDMLRVPAVHRATGTPAFLVAPATVPSPGLLFRDVPEFSPVPIMSRDDLKDWPVSKLLAVEVPCFWRQ